MNPYTQSNCTARVLHFDTETRSTVDLKKTGAHAYLADPETGIRCLTWAVDDGEIGLWQPGDPVPAPFVTAASQEGWVVVAHNAMFDHLVLERILTRYGFPAIDIHKFRCTAAMCRALSLPGALADAAKALDLPEELQKGDSKIMLQMAKPRAPRKGEDTHGVYFYEDTGRAERLLEYNARDTASMRAIWYELRHRRLSDREQRLWLLDWRINDRGFYIDADLAEAGETIAAAVQYGIEGSISRLTGGVVRTIKQLNKAGAWLAAQGVHLPNLRKETIDKALAGDLPVTVRQVLDLRQQGAAASAAKSSAFLNRRSSDGRVRGAFRYYGAHTGRWSSHGIQVQNLKRFEADNLDELIAAVRSRDIANVRAVHPKPLVLVGGLSRSLIVAPPGRRLLGADFSAIESRVLAVLAGESWKIRAYEEYDRTGNKSLEPYRVIASRMLGLLLGDVTEEHRKTGKTADLACGYQGWERAIERFAPGQFSEQQRIDIAAAWRRQHPQTEMFWRRLQNAAWDAVATSSSVDCGPVTFIVKGSGLWMRIQLPSGRLLHYPHPKNVLNDGRMVIEYAKWDNFWKQENLYGGKLAENITQAVARDILADAMLRLDAAGFEIVAHVHDEIVCEIGAGSDRDAEFLEIMTQRPSWFADCPIAANMWTGERFG